MINLNRVLKSRDITLPTNICLVKAMVFPGVTYGCESWAIKKAECWRTGALELWCWRRLFSYLNENHYSRCRKPFTTLGENHLLHVSKDVVGVAAAPCTPVTTQGSRPRTCGSPTASPMASGLCQLVDHGAQHEEGGGPGLGCPRAERRSPAAPPPSLLPISLPGAFNPPAAP